MNRESRRIAAWGVAIVLDLTCAIACGGGGGGGKSFTIVAMFQESGTAPAPDLVRLAGTTAGDLVVLDVNIGGPTSNDDLFAFAFDIALDDESVVELVQGSAVAGSALKPGGMEQLEVLAAQNGNRITVGVTKLGPTPSGNGIPTGEQTVVTLQLRLLRKGASSHLRLVGSYAMPPAAIDSTGEIIPSVQFDAQPALVAGS